MEKRVPEQFMVGDRKFNKDEIEKFVKYSKEPLSFIKDWNYGYDFGEMSQLQIQDFQIDIVNTIHESQNIIIKKSRQMYMSQLMAAYCAWNLMFKFDYQIAIVCNKGDISTRFVQRVREILYRYNIIFDCEKDIVTDNKKEIRLANGSMIKGFAPGRNAGRGYSIDLLIFDEAAYIKNLGDLWMSIGMATNAKRGKCILCSTPNHMDFFARVWAGCVTDENDFSAINIDWTKNPRHTKDSEIRNGELWSPWYEEQCKMLQYNQDAIDRELWGKFVSGVKPNVSKRINFRVESEIYDKIIDKINEKDISLSDYVKNLIKKDLNLD